MKRSIIATLITLTFAVRQSPAQEQPPAKPPAAAPTASAEGTAMEASAIAEKWKATPAPAAAPALPPGVRTRSARPASGPVPTLRTRGIGLSVEALKANEVTLKNLTPRGMKPLYGQEAVAAQRAQDVAVAGPQLADERSKQPTAVIPSAFVQVPVTAEKQIAFRLHFKLDSTEFDDVSQGARQVATIATAMKSLPETTCFLLEGHTCDRGEDAHNQKLSESRALAIRTLLTGYGVNPGRLLAVGLGEREPETPNTSEPNRALNRRVVIGPIELPALP